MLAFSFPRAAQSPRGVAERLDYQAVPFSCALAQHPGFDVISMLEVLEHVDSPRAVLQTACTPGVLKPGGALLVSTLNRSPLAYTEAIVAAESVLGRWIESSRVES